MRQRSAGRYYRELFGAKTAKITVDGGFTCPNRDGSKAYGGCIFCGERGSGDFAGDRHERRLESVAGQFEKARERLLGKWRAEKYIIYFQAFTNTYAPVERLRELYNEALRIENVVGLSIATRPDCIGDDVLSLLSDIAETHYVMVELGLQTSNEETAAAINRQFSNAEFTNAARRLRGAGVDVCAHIIIGLPNETKEDMIRSVKFAVDAGITGIKLQLLHILRDAPIYERFKKGEVRTLEFDEYVDIICDILKEIPDDIVIHRLTGDGARKNLAAPLWSTDKKRVLNEIYKRTGEHYEDSKSSL